MNLGFGAIFIYLINYSVACNVSGPLNCCCDLGSVPDCQIPTTWWGVGGSDKGGTLGDDGLHLVERNSYNFTINIHAV